MTMVETRLVCGGVDTHSLVHVAAVVDHNGGLLGIEEFEVTGPAMRSCSTGCAASVR